MAKNVPPKDRADAFNKAIAALHNWTAEEKRDTAAEPSIVQRYSIDEICDLLEAFDGPMPENAYQFLCWLADQHSGEPPQDRSYASGAKCLRSLWDKYRPGIAPEPQQPC